MGACKHSSGSGPAMLGDHIVSLLPLYSVLPRHKRKRFWLDIIHTDMHVISGKR